MWAHRIFRGSSAEWVSQFYRRREGLLPAARLAKNTSAASYSLWCGKEALGMSRIGKKSIAIPEKVKMAVTDTGAIKVEGPRGKLEWVFVKHIKLRVAVNEVVVERNNECRSVNAVQGLSRRF